MTFGELGMALVMVGSAPYIFQIIHGTVRPSRSSWFVWTFILALALIGYRSSGADDSIWFLVGDFLVTMVIFLLSLWRGSGGWTRIDVACLSLAGLSLLLWQSSDVALFALWGALIADAIAVAPTIMKSLRDPQSEDASAYIFSSLGALCGLLAVAQWNLTLLFYPAYLFLANMSVALVIVVGKYQISHLRGAKELKETI
jgi:hypothetical protein